MIHIERNNNHWDKIYGTKIIRKFSEMKGKMRKRIREEIIMIKLVV